MLIKVIIAGGNCVRFAQDCGGWQKHRTVDDNDIDKFSNPWVKGRLSLTTCALFRSRATLSRPRWTEHAWIYALTADYNTLCLVWKKRYLLWNQHSLCIHKSLILFLLSYKCSSLIHDVKLREFIPNKLVGNPTNGILIGTYRKQASAKLYFVGIWKKEE